MFQLICKDGHARRGAFTTPHGTVQTPVFMNVGTQAAIKGALSAEDLETIGCQVELSNTYHLHVRPGDELIRDLGGLHKFMTWEKPILTDSGGFQIFSLAQLSEDHGRRRCLQLPCGRPAHFHGAGREYAHSGQSWLGYCDGV